MFYDRRAVTIRKPHKCWGCNREFPKGTKMAYDSWIDSTKWVHGYFCSTCVDLINEYCQDYLDFEFCRGDLLEEAIERDNWKENKKTMPEYTIRDEAMTIPVLPKEQRIQFRNVDEAFEEGWRQALECLAFLPVTDVVEVRHGFWKNEEAGWQLSKTAECSQCKKRVSYYIPWKFCPHCGAKMDGGQDE